MESDVFHQTAHPAPFRTVGPDAARTLVDTRALVFLTPFLRAPRGQQEVARELGVSLQRLRYWVGKFERLGLLRQVGERARGGSPVRLFQATARTFFVPFEATSAPDLAGLLRAQLAPFEQLLPDLLARAFGRLAGDWGVRIRPAPERGIDIDLASAAAPERDWQRDALEPDAPALVEATLILTLPRARVKALQRELAAVVARYEAESQAALGEGAAGPEASDRHLLRVALAPIGGGGRR